MRMVALALRDAEELVHQREPHFRAHGTVFAGLSEDGKIGYAKLSLDLQAGLLRAHPEIYFPAPGDGGVNGWTYFYLEELYVGELCELVEEAFWVSVETQVQATS